MPDPRIKNEKQYEALVKKDTAKKNRHVLPIRQTQVRKAEKPNLTKNGQKKNFKNKPAELV